MKYSKAERRLRNAVRAECFDQLRAFLHCTDPDTGELMLDVLTAHAALGYGLNVGVQVRHPEEDGRAVEDPSVTEAENKPASLIEVASG